MLHAFRFFSQVNFALKILFSLFFALTYLYKLKPKVHIIMPNLFPPEIIKSSCENYFAEQRTSSQIIYVTVLIFLLAAIGLLPFVTVQITTQSEGVVRSGYEDNPVVPVVTGQVVSCRIAENKAVSKGDTLLVIASDQVDLDLKLQAFRQKEDSLMLLDLQLLIRGETTGLHTTLYKQEFLTYSGRLTEQKTQLKQAEQEFILAETLFKKGITPKHDFDKINNQFQFERNRFNTIREQQLSLWQEKLKETALNIEELHTKSIQLKVGKKLYCLTAPVSGVLTGYSGIREGNFTVPNQPIARISPDNELLVECYVSPSDIGLIQKEMAATFQFHAYNYNIWGIAGGCVKEISDNVINIGNNPYFRVRCQLNDQFLQLKNGTKGYLIKGMSATSRFKVADRTLFQLLYDKADNWLNPKRKNG